MTRGNNVFAWKGFTTNLTVQSAEETFDYAYDPLRAPNVTANVNAARTNAFYVANAVHDFAYRYGFTEEAFNFQNDNFGKGGLGNDRVNISVQDSSSVNNANFLAPPEYAQAILLYWTRADDHALVAVNQGSVACIFGP